jgi:energy-coupling factor transport system ATP-binding protein
LVKAENLTVRLRSRGLRERREHLALHGVNASVATAAVTGVTGASGAGKSTLLRALGGLVKPSSGRVRAAPALAGELDRPPHRWGAVELASRVGWVPQDPEHGFVTNRVVDEVRATAERLGRAVDAEQLLHLLALSHVREASPYRLSGGEQRRLGLLGGLAHRPVLALLDEPTVGQDRNTWAAVVGVLRALAGGGCGVVVATHDRALLDAAVDHEYVLDRGSRLSVR